MYSRVVLLREVEGKEAVYDRKMTLMRGKYLENG